MNRLTPPENHPQSYAALLLHFVMDSHRSDLPQLLNLYPINKAHKKIAHHCLYGSIRWYELLCCLTVCLCKKKPPIKGSLLHSTLIIGLYQLVYLQQHPAVSVDETVKACKKIGLRKASGFINGCLRNYLRNQDTFKAQLMMSPDTMHSHPQWLLEQLKQDRPNHWQQIIATNNSTQARHIRINPQHTTKTTFLEECRAQGLERGILSSKAPFALIFPNETDATSLPGYDQGAYYIQNTGAQFLPLLLHDSVGKHILDACCGVGGKTSQLLECFGDSKKIVALEQSHNQLKLFKQNMNRLKVQPAKIIEENLVSYSKKHPNPCFDTVILDAPCTSSGIIGQHPEIKYRITAKRKKTIVKQQKELLDAAWQLLTKKGTLIYMTCSVFKDENEGQIQAFLKRHINAEINPMPKLPTAIDCAVGQLIVPGEHSLGFYYVSILKT